MADPTIAAQDYFAADASLKVQSSNTEEFQTFFPVIENGAYQCSQEFDKGDRYTSEYLYCGGGSPDIDTALGTLLSTFGQVADSKAVTEIRVHFEAGQAAQVTIDGHQHDANAHTSVRQADCSGIIPASSGVGVPTIITVAGTASPVSADLVFTMEHRDYPGADGTHFHGQNVQCRVSLTVNYQGQISGTTAGNWLNIIVTKSDPGDDTPTSSLTAEQFPTVAAP